jgi:hypothetical protein
MPSFLDQINSRRAALTGAHITVDNVLRTATSAVRAIDDAKSAAKNDKRLSSDGRREDITKSARQVVRGLKASRTMIEASRSALNQRIAKSFDRALPKTDPTDVVAALWSFKFIETVSAMPPADAMRFVKANPRALAAVYDSPIPVPSIPKAELTRIVDDHVKQVLPEEFARHNTDTEALELAEAAVGAAVSHVADAIGSGLDHPGFKHWFDNVEEAKPAELAKASPEIADDSIRQALELTSTMSIEDRSRLLDAMLEQSRSDLAA